MHAFLRVLALLALLAPPLSAQAPPRPGQPGWIGFFAGVEQDEPDSGPFVVVLAVADGSPAARAGLAAGDTLLELDGAPLTTDRLVALQGGLRAGERIELTLRRDGGRRTLVVRAEPRPTAAMRVPDPVEIRVEAARRAMMAVDSAMRVARAPRAWARAAEVPEAPPLPQAERTMPFTVHVFRDARTDSLSAALRDVERRLVAARSAESARLRELVARVPSGGRIDTSDRALAELRSRREELTTEHALLRAMIEQIVAERAAAPWAAEVGQAVAGRGRAAAPVGPAAPVAPVARPMTPYVAGRDRVAGARVTPLNPGLAEYFGTGRGVLVVEVAPGTPADEGGLRPGDVLLRVGGVEVDGLEGLRRAVALAPDDRPLAVVLLRRGQRVQVALPR